MSLAYQTMTTYVDSLALFLVIVVALIIAFIVVGVIYDHLRFRRHKGVPPSDFIEEFRSSHVPEEIPAAVYDFYKSEALYPQFSVSPDDSYEEVFHMIHDDIDDDAEHLVNTLGMEMPIEPILREWPTEIKTIREMVLWLNWIRERQGAIAPLKSERN